MCDVWIRPLSQTLKHKKGKLKELVAFCESSCTIRPPCWPSTVAVLVLYVARQSFLCCKALLAALCYISLKTVHFHCFAAAVTLERNILVCNAVFFPSLRTDSSSLFLSHFQNKSICITAECDQKSVWKMCSLFEPQSVEVNLIQSQTGDATTVTQWVIFQVLLIDTFISCGVSMKLPVCLHRLHCECISLTIWRTRCCWFSDLISTRLSSLKPMSPVPVSLTDRSNTSQAI